LELDSTNVLAKIGFFNSKSESELSESDYELVDNLPEGPTKQFKYSDVMFALMMTNQIDEQMPDSLIQMRKKYDPEYIKFRAQLTDSKFVVYNDEGEVIKSGEFRNRKPSGIWKSYGYRNKLHHSFTFSKETDTVVIKYYKPDGDIAKKELTTGMPFTNEGKKFKEIVYWQETPGKNIEYLFVSKDGFTVFDRENPVVFDKSTPDNIIQMSFNPDTHSQEAFIWKNGKKIPYEFCPYDGTTVTCLENGKKKSYRWEDCKKIPIEK
ncbi:MAG TPA: hypothetical protein VJ945_06505, partial [Flavobacteriaceae bacterium]|nr:hypothetical protein [Flavobacteriaceae bacterium]